MSLPTYITRDESKDGPRKSVSTDLYDGWIHHREFTIIAAKVQTALDDYLALGTVMPTELGGPETSTIGTARLQACRVDEHLTGNQVRVSTDWLEITLTATAFSGTFRETTRSRHTADMQHEKRMVMVGICSTTSDAGLPARAKTEAGATPTAITDYVCVDVTVTPEWQHGRVLAVAQFSQFKSGRALSAAVPLSTYYTSRGGNAGGRIRAKEGEIEYAIPHALVEDYRTTFEPADTVSGGAKTIAGAIGAKVLTVTGGAFFTSTAADAGKAITIWGVGTYIIDTVTSTTVAVVTVAFAANFTGKTFAMTGNRVWPGDTGIYARRLDDFREIAECPGRPGFTHVRTIYRVPTMRSILLEDTTKAHIRVASGGQPSKRLVESNGVTTRTIEGQDPTIVAITDKNAVAKPYIVTYQRVGGAPNVAYDNIPHLVVDFAAASISLTTNFGYVGKKNSDTLTNLGATAGQMLCIALAVEKDWDSGALWMCQMHLLYRQAGWTCISRAYVDAVLETWGLEIEAAGTTVFSDRAERIVKTISAKQANNKTGFDDVDDLDVSDGEVAFAAFDTMTSWETTA
ncbi:MAG TPA: hypothetical protein VMZ92_02375 [Planctomycetota bacterium]|nr:hypothetical protein [Planctomycetota bacterium]